uniref:Uncharacterized protein n=1 Tax=Plectus sambesii TaxID=2011161 RepID=A0A914XBT1_9BILA
TSQPTTRNWNSDSTPAYGSIGYQLREVGQESHSLCDFISHTITILAATSFGSGLMLLLFILTSLMAYFGISYFNKCPVQRQIPIYLLVGGGVGMLKIGMIFMKHRRDRQDDIGIDDLEADDTFHGSSHKGFGSKSTLFAEVVVSLFLLSWFAAGNYWVYRVYIPPHSQPERSLEPKFWCDQHVYNFALAQILICHVLLLFGVLVFLSILCCARCYMYSEADWV